MDEESKVACTHVGPLLVEQVCEICGARGEPKLPLSIAFSYPYGNGFDPAWVESLVGLLLYEVGMKTKESRVLGSILKAGSCYVADNRERICIDFNNTSQDDWVLMIDPDIAFESNILEKLKAHIESNPEARIIAGRVDLLNGLPVFYKVDSSRGVNIHQPFAFNGLKEFDLVGTGIICIHREVIVTLHKTLNHAHFFSKIILPSGLGLGDDFSFCARAKSLGFKLYGAWDIRGVHWKSQPCGQRYLDEKDLTVGGK